MEKIESYKVQGLRTYNLNTSHCNREIDGLASDACYLSSAKDFASRENKHRYYLALCR